MSTTLHAEKPSPTMVQDSDIDVLVSTNTFIVKHQHSSSTSDCTTPLSTIIQRKEDALQTLEDYYALTAPARGHGSSPQAMDPDSEVSVPAVLHLIFRCADDDVLLRDSANVEQLMNASEVIREAVAQGPTNPGKLVVGIVVLLPTHSTHDVHLFLEFCKIPHTPFSSSSSPSPPSSPNSANSPSSPPKPNRRHRRPQLSTISSYIIVFSLAEILDIPEVTSRAGCQLLLSDVLTKEPFKAFFVAVRFGLAESVPEEAARATLSCMGCLPLQPEEDHALDNRKTSLVPEEFLNQLGWSWSHWWGDSKFQPAWKALKTYWTECILAVERVTLQCADDPASRVAKLASEVFRGGQQFGRPRCCNWIAIYGAADRARSDGLGVGRGASLVCELVVPLWYYEYVQDLADAVSLQVDPEEGRCKSLAEEIFLHRTGDHFEGEETGSMSGGLTEVTYCDRAVRCSTCSVCVESGFQAFVGAWAEEIAEAVERVELVM